MKTQIKSLPTHIFNSPRYCIALKTFVLLNFPCNFVFILLLFFWCVPQFYDRTSIYIISWIVLSYMKDDIRLVVVYDEPVQNWSTVATVGRKKFYREWEIEKKATENSLNYLIAGKWTPMCLAKCEIKKKLISFRILLIKIIYIFWFDVMFSAYWKRDGNHLFISRYCLIGMADIGYIEGIITFIN